jgi:hypothetical protein
MEDLPRRGAIYRCPVCRLELTYDEERRVLDLPPLERDPADKPARKRS